MRSAGCMNHQGLLWKALSSMPAASLTSEKERERERENVAPALQEDVRRLWAARSEWKGVGSGGSSRRTSSVALLPERSRRVAIKQTNWVLPRNDTKPALRHVFGGGHTKVGCGARVPTSWSVACPVHILCAAAFLCQQVGDGATA